MTRLIQFLRDERGSAIIEFLFVFPTVFTLFTASVESSVYMIRYVMFDRSIDLVVRNLRLGVYGSNLTHKKLKEEICTNGVLGNNITHCMNATKIWMQPINTGTGGFGMGSTQAPCIDKPAEIKVGDPPDNSFSAGVDNDIMLIRVCMKEWPMFPTTGISVKMPVQSDGSVAMIVSSTFVNEPG
ncbi:TadE/TadG family type IV pilus assembly protein [Tabrizicola sp.]|uniref:TadE/TadG family type IV pilus assembly protein n=1 Tax=Tabrizicola sp. TaxID=2005166 RepID=UPI002FDD8475